MKHTFTLKSLLLLLFTCIAVMAFAQPGGRQVFTYTGGDQTFTVPANVYKITVKLWGAGGAGGHYAYQDIGGGGGFATATFAVNPGEQYTVIVGGGGLTGAGPGAYGGGGAKANGAGGRGGGRSALRDISSNEFITAGAGGGGGGGNGTDGPYGIARGGAGGGLTGGPSAWAPWNGGPGTQSAGGAAGYKPSAGVFGGNPGGQFYGGSTNAVENGYNGSGGGGYFGGGGGVDVGDGGGGGGSSFIPGNGNTIGGIDNVPGNTVDVDYDGSAGYGGGYAANGNPGLAVISWGKQYTVKQVFAYTGADQTYTVPANVYKITVKMWGAGGAGGQYVYQDIGGGGGFAIATFAVTPGEQYTVIVGGGGLTGAGAGAYGGGGAKANGAGGRGGGRSALRDVSSNELITAGAGGGGGGGNGTDGPYGIARGGAGGGLTGSANVWPPVNGGPGTQTAGGAAGYSAYWVASLGTYGGNPGGQFYGGATSQVENGFNGSGGSGYFGGGSGTDIGDGGGGGGSSFIPVNGITIGGTDSVPGNTADPDYAGNAAYGGGYAASGNPGLVIISYSGDCSIIPVSVTGNKTVCTGQKITLTAHGNATFTWLPGNVTDSVFSFIPLPDSCTYTVWGQDARGCLTDTITDSIKVKPVPLVLTDNIICSGNVLSSVAEDPNVIIKWKKDGVLVHTDTTGQTYALKFTTVAGDNGYGAGANQFAAPAAVFIDKTGNVYIADADNNRVQQWATGANTGITVAGGNGAGTAANQLQNPAGVFVDTAGNIFIADAGNSRVQKWLPGASAGVTVAGGNGAGPAANQLANPAGIFVDGTGSIYIADKGNNRVEKWLPGASVGTIIAGSNNAGTAATQLQNPMAVFVDIAGNIFVADAGNDRVVKWLPGSQSGIVVAGGNGRGRAAGQLNNPTGVAVNANGYVFVGEAGNNRISEWAQGSKKMITAISNDSSNGYSIIPVNRLSSPAGIALDGAGNVYIADNGNNRISRLSVATHNTLPSSGPGKYTFTASTKAVGCSVSGTITVTSAAPAPPVSISGIKTGLCNKDSLKYNAASQANADSYLWTLPAGLSIVSGQGTRSVLVKNNYTAPFNDSIYVTAGNACGYSLPAVINISGTVPAKPSSISGAKTGLCNIASPIYTTGLQSNANTYTWHLPPGFSFVSGQGSNVITVASNYTSPFNDSISVTAGNACGTGLPLTVSISGTVPSKPSAISGLKTDLCGVSPLIYGVAGQTNASSFAWALPPGLSFISGQNTNTIVAANNYTGPFNDTIHVSAVNTCGSGPLAVISIKSAFTLVTGISGNTSVSAGQAGLNYAFSQSPLYAQYVWTVPKGAVITDGQGTPNITVTWGTVSGNVTVKAINACGDVSNVRALYVTVALPFASYAPVGRTGVTETDDLPSTAFVVYPNPAVNNVTVKFTTEEAGKYEIQLTDAAGKLLMVNKGMASQGVSAVSFNLERLAAGMYTVNFINAKGGIKHFRLLKVK